MIHGSPINIVVEDSYISDDNVSEINSMLRAATWHRDDNNELFITRDGYDVADAISSLGIADRVKDFASYCFGMDLSIVPDMGGFQLRKTGDSMRVHTDAENYLGVMPIDEVLHLNFAKAMTMYVALLYFGDGCTGGELYFPNHEIEVEPKPGTLVMFPTSRMYEHGVREIASGDRYVYTMYFTRKRIHDSYVEMLQLVSTHPKYQKHV